MRSRVFEAAADSRAPPTARSPARTRRLENVLARRSRNNASSIRRGVRDTGAPNLGTVDIALARYSLRDDGPRELASLTHWPGGRLPGIATSEYRSSAQSNSRKGLIERNRLLKAAMPPSSRRCAQAIPRSWNKPIVGMHCLELGRCCERVRICRDTWTDQCRYSTSPILGTCARRASAPPRLRESTLFDQERKPGFRLVSRYGSAGVSAAIRTLNTALNRREYCPRHRMLYDADIAQRLLLPGNLLAEATPTVRGVNGDGLYHWPRIRVSSARLSPRF